MLCKITDTPADFIQTLVKKGRVAQALGSNLPGDYVLKVGQIIDVYQL
jgi:hypothetical protein